MVGCGPDYSLVENTYMATDTMSVLLREIIQRRRPEVCIKGISSHSMKVTLLSWTTKIGLHEDICRALGGHSKPGDDMPRLYGRDFLAEPLRQLGHVLLWVTDGDFKPDESRSGRWTGTPTMKVQAPTPGCSAASLMAVTGGTCLKPPSGNPASSDEETDTQESTQEPTTKHHETPPEETCLSLVIPPVIGKPESPRASIELQTGGMPPLSEEALELAAESSDDEPLVHHEEWMVKLTEESIAAAATTEITSSAPTAGEDGQKLIFAPPGFIVIRSRYSGSKHWSLQGGIPCCPPIGAAFREKNFDKAETHGDRVCSRCLRTAERTLGILNAREFVGGKIA